MEKLEEEIKDMTPKLIGEVYLKLNKQNTKYIEYGIYECPYCKKEFECVSTYIKYKGTRSCGCLRKIPKFKHGLNSNKFYKTWG